MSVIHVHQTPRKIGRPPLWADILPHTSLARNLVLCYLCNSHPANKLYDSSKFKHHSHIIQNLVSTQHWRPSSDGMVLSLFETAAQRVDCDFLHTIGGVSQATIVASVKLRTTSARASVGKGGFNLDVLDDSYTYMGMDGVYARFVNPTNTDWQQIAFVFNGNLPNDQKIKGYKNGIEQPLDINGTLPVIINNDSFNRFYINYSTEFGVYGNAYYRFVGVWDRVLTQPEISRLYEDQQYSWLLMDKYIKYGITLSPPPYIAPFISDSVNLNLCLRSELEYILEL